MQRGKHSTTGAAIAVIILVARVVVEPVPAFNALAAPHNLH